MNITGFLDDYFVEFVIFALIWNVLGIGFLLWRRKNRGLVLPKVTDPEVIFYERTASGNSHKNWLTRIAGASNCLTLIVTDSHLVLTTFFPFTAFAGVFDLEHLIPLERLASVNAKGKTVKIEFSLGSEKRRISLLLGESERFLAALSGTEKLNCPVGVDGK